MRFHLGEPGQFRLAQTGGFRNESCHPAFFLQVRAQLGCEPSLARPADTGHDGHGQVLQAFPGLGIGPVGEFHQFVTTSEGHDSRAGLDQLQRASRSTRGGFQVARLEHSCPRWRVDRVGSRHGSTQRPDVDAHVPVPTRCAGQEVRAPAHRRLPVSERGSVRLVGDLLHINGQQITRASCCPVDHRFQGHVVEQEGFVHHLVVRDRFGSSTRQPRPVTGDEDDAVTVLVRFGHRQDHGVQPGVQGSATEGHAQVEAGALPRGAEHLLHGADELGPGPAVRGFQYVPDTQLRHELEDRLRLLLSRAAVRAGEFSTIPRRDHVGDGAGGHVLDQPGRIRDTVPTGTPNHRITRGHRRLRSWFGCSLCPGRGLS